MTYRAVPSAELLELRERAYGPRADIEADPDAVRRLRELEAAHRALEQPGPAEGDARSGPDVDAVEASAPAPAPEAPGSGRSDDGGDPHLFADDSAGTLPAAIRRIWARRSVRLAAAASVLGLVIGLVGGVALGARLFGPPTPSFSMGVQTGTDRPELGESGSQIIPGYMGLDDAEPQWHGRLGDLDVWTVNDPDVGGCIALMSGDQPWNLGCTPAPWATQLDTIVMTPTLPGDIVTPEAADGSFVRLVLRGDSVDVYVTAPPMRSAAG